MSKEKEQGLKDLLKVGEELVSQKKLPIQNGNASKGIYHLEADNPLAAGQMSRYIRQVRECADLPPIDISDVKQVEDRINWYLDKCEMNDTKPTVLGLCNVIGIDRKTLYRWGAGIDRAATHQKVVVKYKNLLEELWEMEMLEGKINPVTGIFIGKNHFGYTDKQDIVVAPKLGAMDTVSTEELEQRYLDSVVCEDV